MTNSINGQSGNKNTDYWNSGAQQVLDLLADQGHRIAEQRSRVDSSAVNEGMNYIGEQASFAKELSDVAKNAYEHATTGTETKRLWRYMKTMSRQTAVTTAARWAGGVANAVTGVGDALVALDSDRSKGDRNLTGFMQSALKSTTQSLVGVGATTLILKGTVATLGTGLALTSTPVWAVGGALIGGGVAAYTAGRAISSFFNSDQ